MQPNIEITVNTTVSMHPKRMRSVPEIDKILLKIGDYEQKVNVPAGVIVIQNKQLGASYRIEARDRALNMINNPRVCEWGLEYYPRSYFEKLRQSLNSDGTQQKYEH